MALRKFLPAYSAQPCNKCLISTRTHLILPDLETHLPQTSLETILQMRLVSRKEDVLWRLCRRLPFFRMGFSGHKKALRLPSTSTGWFPSEHRVRWASNTEKAVPSPGHRADLRGRRLLLPSRLLICCRSEVVFELRIPHHLVSRRLFNRPGYEETTDRFSVRGFQVSTRDRHADRSSNFHSIDDTCGGSQPVVGPGVAPKPDPDAFAEPVPDR